MIDFTNIFNSLKYVEIIKHHIHINKNEVYGYKAKLAQAAGCQRSYLSQILAGQTHFTLEHAIRVCKFWNYRKAETDYFINLVEFNRSGTKELKDYFYEKLILIRKEQENLSKRMQHVETLPQEKAAIFYSHWQHMAVIVLLTVPQFRSSVAIARRLNLPENAIIKVLHQLQELGLVQSQGQEWIALEKTIHIAKDSPFNTLNHTNWRNQAVQNSFLHDSESIHYTSVCSLSQKDVAQIKDLIFHLIDKSRDIVAPSLEEEVYCLTCDWFKI